MWPHEGAVGKRLKQGWPESEDPRHPWREVVGVVGDCKQTGLGTNVFSETFLPFSQGPWSRVYVMLRAMQVGPLYQEHWTAAGSH